MIFEKSYTLKASEVLNKLNVLLMRDGKKKTVRRKMNTALQTFAQTKHKKIRRVDRPDRHMCHLTAMLYQVKPSLETRQVRKGSKYYDVPFDIKENRRLSLALRWVARGIRKRPEAGLINQLQAEFHDLASLKKGYTVREKKILQKRVRANIKYIHFRWR